MARYRVRRVEPTTKDVECFAVEVVNEGGVYFYVGNVLVQRLRPDGTLVRYIVNATHAAEVGLQLDHEGKVRCH